METVLHELKVWPEFYQKIIDKEKPWEYRKNDRGFEVGHILHLREWNPETEDYTERASMWDVLYVLEGGEFGIPEGDCIMTIENCNSIFNPSPDKDQEVSDIKGGKRIKIDETAYIDIQITYTNCFQSDILKYGRKIDGLFDSLLPTNQESSRSLKLLDQFESRYKSLQTTYGNEKAEACREIRNALQGVTGLDTQEPINKSPIVELEPISNELRNEINNDLNKDLIDNNFIRNKSQPPYIVDDNQDRCGICRCMYCDSTLSPSNTKENKEEGLSEEEIIKILNNHTQSMNYEEGSDIVILIETEQDIKDIANEILSKLSTNNQTNIGE